MSSKVWQRKCPMCARLLEKPTLQEPWVCICGWTTADRQHRRTENNAS